MAIRRGGGILVAVSIVVTVTVPAVRVLVIVTAEMQTEGVSAFLYIRTSKLERVRL